MSSARLGDIVNDLAGFVRLPETAAEMRRLFDRTFSEPELLARSDIEPLIQFAIKGQRFAFLQKEVRGILRLPHLTRLPSDQPALSGVFANRGVLCAVFSLSDVLGLPLLERPSFVALSQDSSIGLSFDELVGQVSVASSELVRNEARDDVLWGFFERENSRLAIINLDAVVRRLTEDSGVALREG